LSTNGILFGGFSRTSKQKRDIISAILYSQLTHNISSSNAQLILFSQFLVHALSLLSPGPHTSIAASVTNQITTKTDQVNVYNSEELP
jgi:hypothetical protein